MTQDGTESGPLSGRVAIVTGAGGGLGRRHALYLATKGAKVVVNDLDQGAADRVAGGIRASGGDALAFGGSVTDVTAVDAMAAQTIERWGRVDILVNNAGILRDKTFAKMTLDDFRLVVDVHLMGSVICTKAVWEIMRSQKYGRVVMTTSSSGLYGNIGQANYGAAKMALVGLMQTLAMEGDRFNIRVNCLAPTAATQMTHDVLDSDTIKHLDAGLVSPALLALTGDDAPNRVILCAGAGHFARANVTLTLGIQVAGPDAGEQVAARLTQISDRTGEVVPAYGFFQVERELASAKTAATSTGVTL